MNQKAIMINEIKEIARQRYEYIDLSMGLSVLDEVLGNQDVLVFYIIDRRIFRDYRYMDGIETLVITGQNKLYEFNFEAASVGYEVVDPCTIRGIEVQEFLPDALLPRKDKTIQMQIVSTLDTGASGTTIWLDATPDEVKQLKAFVSVMSNYIGLDT